MKVLVLNSGSSSIKYALYQFPAQHLLLSGLLENIANAQSEHHFQVFCAEETQQGHLTHAVPDHAAGLAAILANLKQTQQLTTLQQLFCIGHRVVHGGEYFDQPTLINAQVIAQIRAMIPLAPLHNPANLAGIEVALQLAPEVPQVAIFDTAFHQTLPAHAYHYAVPLRLYTELHLRRYGFHGTSHAYLAQQAAQRLGKPLAEINIITLHIGNGASACAIRKGQSVDTSMGLSPLEGLMMGTRSGDLDPAVFSYLSRCKGWSILEIDHLLNYDSGLKGICGQNDMRQVMQLAAAENAPALLARAMYCYRLKKYIGAYLAVLGDVDALVFSGGIGEHDSALRAACCENLHNFGIQLDGHKNQQPEQSEGAIHVDHAPIALFVIPTNEELAIAEQAYALCHAL